MSEESPQDLTKDRADILSLEARLLAARGQGGKAGASRDRALARPQGMGLAARIVLEMVTTVLVGAALGIVLDRWLGTAPWLLVVFLFLGAAAGLANVYRVVKGLDDGVGLGRAIDGKRRPESSEEQQGAVQSPAVKTPRDGQ